jgi:hypothetical protein
MHRIAGGGWIVYLAGHSHRALLIPSILFFVCTAGCGRGSTPGDSAGKAVTGTEAAHVDNCSLVTDAEASSLAGKDLKHDEDGPLGCPFVQPGQSMGQFIVRAFNGTGAAKDNFGEHSADTTVHEIKGVGDSAAVLAREEHVNFLIVQKGNRYVQFVTTFLSDMNLDSPQLKQAEELALKALDRIPD